MTTTKGTLVASKALLPTATLVRNILKTYRSATDAQLAQGMTWYEEAHALALVLDPADPARAAGVISALSPRVLWSYNQKLAIRLYAEGGLTSGGLSGNLAKANAIYNGADIAETLRASKTVAFAGVINDPTDPYSVVVDRHAVSVALGRQSTDAEKESVSKRAVYDHYADAYRIAARRAGISPSQMQAVTWVVWRQTAIRTAAAVLRSETVAA
jgi:hypothetical protein